MKLQRLAGFGPNAAIVSGISMFLFLIILIFAPLIFGKNFGLELVFGVLLLLAMVAWPAGMLVVGVDLEWLEHADTHTGRMQVSLVAALIAIFLPILFVVTLVFFGKGNLPSLPMGLLGLAMSVFLLIQNLEARKAGLLRGALPWFGIVAGVLFGLMGIGWLLSFASPIGFLIALPSWMFGMLAYAVWAFWLGVHLHRGTVVATPAAAARAPA